MRSLKEEDVALAGSLRYVSRHAFPTHIDDEFLPFISWVMTHVDDAQQSGSCLGCRLSVSKTPFSGFGPSRKADTQDNKDAILPTPLGRECSGATPTETQGRFDWKGSVIINTVPPQLVK